MEKVKNKITKKLTKIKDKVLNNSNNFYYFCKLTTSLLLKRKLNH